MKARFYVDLAFVQKMSFFYYKGEDYFPPMTITSVNKGCYVLSYWNKVSLFAGFGCYLRVNQELIYFQIVVEVTSTCSAHEFFSLYRLYLMGFITRFTIVT